MYKRQDKGQAAARKKQAAELNKAEKRKAEVDTLFARIDVYKRQKQFIIDR